MAPSARKSVSGVPMISLIFILKSFKTSMEQKLRSPTHRLRAAPITGMTAHRAWTLQLTILALLRACLAATVLDISLCGQQALATLIWKTLMVWKPAWEADFCRAILPSEERWLCR